jgi:hypothetical protein
VSVAGARGALARLPDAGRWEWPLAWILVLAGFAAWVAGHGPAGGALLWLGTMLSSWQSLALPLWAALACAVPGRWGVAIRVVHGLAAAALLGWYAASLELFLDQGRTLTPEELWFRLRDAPSRAFVVEILCSWRTLGAATMLAATMGGLALALGRLPRRACLVGTVSLLATAQLGGMAALGSGWFGDVDHYVTVQRPLAAPWSWIQRHHHDAGLQRPPLALATDLAGAAAVRRTLDPAWWADGPDPLLGPLCGAYRGRNVVVLLLESHRLCDVAPLAAGAHRPRDLSPELAALAARGVFLGNYVQAGLGTLFAQYSVLTGLPCPPAFDLGLGTEAVSPGAALAAAGRIPDLAALGYRCEWLQATPTSFARWESFMHAADMAYLIDPQEVSGFARGYWSAWGMPDEQLLAIAMRRQLAHLAAGRRALQVVLTISNHSPYLLPPIPGVELPGDHSGGMRYADHWAARFIAGLLDLPADQRPVVLVTGDHTFQEGLLDAQPLGTANPEGIRIPGLLFLPDGRGAGTRCDSPFVHEDLLDLAYALVAEPGPAPAKFRDRHRIAAPTVVAGQQAVITADGYHVLGRAYGLASPWSPTSDPPEPVRARLDAAMHAARRFQERLWGPEPP